MKNFTLAGFAFTFMFVLVSWSAPSKRISGEAVVSIAEDFRTKKSEMIYSVLEKSGKSQRLQFKAGTFPLWFQSGKKIDVVVSETAMSTDAAEVLSITQVAAAFESPYVTTNRKVLLMRLNSPEGQAYLSRETILSAMYDSPNSVAAFYLRSTRGKFTFVGDGNGDGQHDILDVNLNVTVSTSCDYNGWAATADAEAVRQGFDLSQYQHLAYVLPTATSKCFWSGFGNVSGKRSWYRYGNSFAHELAHNIGLHHASDDPDNDGVFQYEYGDGSSMPNGTNYNSVYTEKLGLLSAWPGQIAIGGAGLQQLSALGMDPTAALFPQIIKIKRGTTGSFYYLSLRTAAALDTPLNPEYVGVSVHTYGSGRSLLVKVLKPGEVFQDSVNGIEVAALNYSSDGQAIGIDVRAVCNQAAPELTLSPSQVYANAAGAAVINWTLKNNDGVYCPATSFNFAGTAPAGVAVSAPPAVTLLPGALASGSVSLQAGSSLAAFTFTLTAAGAGHLAVGKSVPVAFDLIAPESAKNLNVVFRKGVATLTWAASLESGSGVAEYRVYRNGEQIAATTSTSFSDYGLTAGTYSYSVIAVDNAGNLSVASSPVLLTVKAASKGRR